jgi:V-type H+-transporting ATPase subunit d
MSQGGLAAFNMQDGFVEGLIRGYRSTFLGRVDYHHLTQCDSLDDLKTNLQETDYDHFLGNEAFQILYFTASPLMSGLRPGRSAS